MKEFSRFSGIAQTTLRHWDTLGLFPPAYRDPDTNYRYYTPAQIIAVKFIAILSSLRVPLNTISTAQHGRTPESIIEMIEQQEKMLDMEMLRLRESYSLIHTRLGLIRQGVRQGGMEHTDESVRILPMQDMSFILGNPNEYGDEKEFFAPFIGFCQKADDLRINLNYPIVGYHKSMHTFLRAPGLPEYFASIDPTGNRVCPAGHYLIGQTRGNYGELGDLPDKMAAFAKENALALTGPVFTMYLHDEVCMDDPSRYLAQVRVAVKQ